MDLTPHERFPFPEANDPGNGALDLQILAEAIDAKCVTMLADLRRIVNRPMRLVTLNGNGPNTIIANAFFDMFTAGAGQWVSQIDTTGVLSFDVTQMSGMGTTPGVYRLGVIALTNPAVVVTANSIRTIRLTATIPVSDPSVFPAPSTTAIKRSQTNVYECGVGVTDMQCELEFATAFPQTTVLDAEITHANVGSNLVLLTGSVMYLYRVGDVDI